MKKLQFNDFFIIFIFSGILGVIIETLFWFLKSGEFAHRGSLIYTPINLIYSIGAILLTLLVYKMDIKNPFKIFIISFIAGTLIEYLASYLQELTLGTTSWDYSKKFLNINGRVSLVYSSFWAFLGCIWALYILPPLIKLVYRVPYKTFLTTFGIIFLVFDMGISFYAAKRYNERSSGIESNKKIDIYFDKKYDDQRMKKLFPNAKRRH